MGVGIILSFALALFAGTAVYIALLANFFHRWIDGRLIPTISTKLTLERTSDLASKGLNDYLVVNIHLRKEEGSGAVRLEDVIVELFRVNPGSPDTSRIVTQVDGRRWPLADNRSLDQRGELVSRRHPNSIWTIEEGRTLNLAPPESTQFASYERIEADGVYEVMVSVVGVRYKRGSEYTRRYENPSEHALHFNSSAISVPIGRPRDASAVDLPAGRF